jgi:thiamine kinase-like enzyme
MKLDVRIPFTDVHIKGHDPATSTGPQAGMREWTLGWIKVQAPRPRAADTTVGRAAIFAPRVPLTLPLPTDRFDAEDALAGLNAVVDRSKGEDYVGGAELSSGRAVFDHVNPKLGAVRIGGNKQYTFEGRPLFRPYTHGGPKDTTQPLQEIGRGKFHVVYAKRNPQSPVLAKVPRHEVTNVDLQQARIDGRVMDALAQLLVSDDDQTTRTMSQHFAIELLKEIRDGKPTFYTQAVDGFTLEDYFANPGQHRDKLPPSAVPAKARELLNAVEWLHDKGFVHRDMHLGNIMYDRASGKLVLIDFENVMRSKGAEESYDIGMRTLRGTLAAKFGPLGP